MIARPVAKACEVVARQRGLGDAGQLPEDRVRALAPLLESGERVLARVADRDGDIRTEQFRAGHGETPGYGGAPVVTDDVHRLGNSQCGQQPGEIAEDPVHLVVRLARRRVGFPETTQIGCDDPIAGSDEAR